VNTAPSGNVSAAFVFADRIESGTIQINHQTIADEPTNPFGRINSSSSGGHFGSLDSCCEIQWVTMQSKIERHPFWVFKKDSVAGQWSSSVAKTNQQKGFPNAKQNCPNQVSGSGAS
jgi:hypothetical protein